MKGSSLIALIILLFAAGCRHDAEELMPMNEPFVIDLPPGFNMPPVPDDNPLTVASVELGERLFFEKRMSGDGTLACASCHFAGNAFSDTVAKSEGTNGQLTMRNSPTLMNVAYHPAYFKDGGNPTLEIQSLAPIHDEVEMASNIHNVADLLRDEEPYRELSQRAYGEPLNAFIITRALASFERTLISGNRFHHFFYLNDQTALTAEEHRGWNVFSSPEANCTVCHNGPDLSNYAYENIGLYLNYADAGRQRISLNNDDLGKFKVPTLNNIALTGPYMHDGSIATLEEVVDHFMNGGEAHPNKSNEVGSFTLTPLEKDDLLAFLNALTDEKIDQ